MKFHQSLFSLNSVIILHISLFKLFIYSIPNVVMIYLKVYSWKIFYKGIINPTLIYYFGTVGELTNLLKIIQRFNYL